MTATYPKTPPVITVKEADLREATMFKIQKFMETKPREFAKDEQEMIDKIVEGIRDILEDAAQAKANGKYLPSLEEERERHEAAMAELAQKNKEEEDRRRKEETKEEERVISQMLQQQLERQRQKAKESKISRRPSDLPQNQPTESSEAETERIDFDRLCTTADKAGNVIAFRSVMGRCDARKGQVSIVYTVRPILSNGQGSLSLALKQASLRQTGKDLKEFKKQLQSLESRLQGLKTGKGVQHRNILEVLDFKVESGADNNAAGANAWTVSILTPLADRGSLDELLELAGHIEMDKVRSWTRDLLDALNFLHNKNMAHQDIHAGNVLLIREPTGEIVPKLADGWFQREIHSITAAKQSLPGLYSAKSAYWLPPEIAAASKPQYTYKTDIWDFGVVFVQMIFGLNVLRKYSSPKNLMESLMLSHSLQELVSRFFKEDKQKRPRAFELGSSEFLATDAPVLFEDTSAVLSTSASVSSLQPLPTRLRRDSSTRGVVSSRYAEDFVEEGRLGKGGFGEVVKARKKLDGQIYAIKKITQRSQASLTEILKEVRLLSQLTHPAVVRYYNTWVEEVPDLTDTEGDTSTDDLTEETGDTGSAGIDIQFATSTGGLDFMSSNAAVEFESDDETEEEDYSDDSDENEDDSDQEYPIRRVLSPERERQIALQRRARLHRSFRTVLYISMEYCEKRVSTNESWSS